MGAKGQNYYNALVARYGYEREAREIQELYLGGKKLEAIAAVPDALVDEVALVGDRDRIADRLEVWKESAVTTLLIQTHDPAALRTMAELLL
jgi:alkanesulfonate monooxygenase SsuD/methylene tetrahydromethanopterin reductase-like flavin-dependent oxidoreductase (luciferase family)